MYDVILIMSPLVKSAKWATSYVIFPYNPVNACLVGSAETVPTRPQSTTHKDAEEGPGQEEEDV